MAAIRVYTARWILPITAPAVADGAVAVDDAGRITYVGPATAAPAGARYPLGEAVLLPGLVAVAQSATAPPDLLDRASAAGVTTLVGPAASAAPFATPVRGRGVATVALDPAPLGDAAAAFARLRAAVAVMRESLDTAGNRGRVQVGVRIPPLHGCDEELLLDVAAWSVGEDLPLVIPAGASAAEIAYLRDASGPYADARRAAGSTVVRRAHSTVHLLAELGIAAVARPLLLGGAWFDESDVALAACYDCPVAYVAPDVPEAPCSLAALRAAGVRVALAYDPYHARELLAVARALAPTPADALNLITLGGAHALGLDGEIGSLEPGKADDLCAFALAPAALEAVAAHGVAHALLHDAAPALVLATVQGRRVPHPAVDVPTFPGAHHTTPHSARP